MSELFKMKFWELLTEQQQELLSAIYISNNQSNTEFIRSMADSLINYHQVEKQKDKEVFNYNKIF